MYYEYYASYSGVGCTDTLLGPVCGPCPDGYVGDGSKENCTETCTLDPCFSSVVCTDTTSGPVCGPCPAGYEGDGTDCLDIDEVQYLLFDSKILLSLFSLISHYQQCFSLPTFLMVE